MDQNFKQEGCEITWKIENFQCLFDPYDSPIFHLNKTEDKKYYLRLNIFESERLVCYLESNERRVNATVCYDISISSNGESKEKFGISAFKDYPYVQLIQFLPEKPFSIKNLQIRVCLNDISDLTFPNSFSYRIKFRTVMDVETKKEEFYIPHFNELPEKQEFFFRILPVCKESNRFELKMWVTYDKDDSKTLHIDISEFSKTKEVCTFIETSAENPNEKLISTVTQTHKFQPNSNSVCSLKIPFTVAALKKFDSFNHKLRLKCELMISENKMFTWVEEACKLPVQQAISQESTSKRIEKEKVNLRDDFLCLYVEGKRADAVITARGRKFPVHKTILSARSPVFAAMFDANMAEKESGAVEIVDVEPETLDQMLFFMYSEILQTEEYEKVFKVYEAADKYQVLTLRDECSTFLRKLLDIQNAVEVWSLADMHHDAELQNSVEVFIGANAKRVFQTQECKDFMVENSSLGCKLMHKYILYHT